MTNTEALYSFFASFGIPAYEENAVPTNTPMPYITYRLVLDAFDRPTTTTASIWYRSTSWVDCSAKADEIGAYIGRGGTFHNGVLIRRGSPFAQTMNDADDCIKRIILNVSVEFQNE